jgi:pimeloyl-ACP methyl ester carboxylesterase
MFTPDRPVDALKARWAQPPSQFVAMDGMQVHVRDEGPKEDTTPIVLLHGSGASLHTWDQWTNSLKTKHRVIRLDRPGFGLTGPNPTGDYSMTFNTDFTLRFLDRMQVKRAVLVGNSSGGRVAWHVAAASPERVERLVLIDAGGYPRSTPLPLGLRIAMSPWLSPIMSRILPRSAVEKSLRNTYGDPSKVTDALVDRNYEITLRQGNRRALGATLRAQEYDDSVLIRSVRTPTLIIWGALDTVVPPSDAQRFHDDIANSQVVILPGVGHLVQEENPTDSLSAFEKFFASHS